MASAGRHCPYGCGADRPAVGAHHVTEGAGPRGPAGGPGGASWRCPACSGKCRVCTGCGTSSRLFARYCRKCRLVLPPWAHWPAPRGAPSIVIGGSAPWARADVVPRPLWSADGIPSGLTPAQVAAGCGGVYAYGDGGELSCIDVLTGQEVDRQRPAPEPVGVRFTPDGLGAREGTDEVVAALGRGRFVVYMHAKRGPEEAGSSGPTPLAQVLDGYPPRGFDGFVMGPVLLDTYAACLLSGPRAFGLIVFDIERRAPAGNPDDLRTFGGHPAFVVAAGTRQVMIGSTEGGLKLIGIPDGRGVAEWQVVGGLPRGPALEPCVLDGHAFVMDATGRLFRCRLEAGSSLEPVGQVHVPEASAMAVSREEIAVGDRRGRVWRFSPRGLEPRSWTPSLPSEAAPGPVDLAPIVFADGCAIAPTSAGTAVALLPRPRLVAKEVAFSFSRGGSLASLMWLDGLLVGATARGEAACVELVTREAT